MLSFTLPVQCSLTERFEPKVSFCQLCSKFTGAANKGTVGCRSTNLPANPLSPLFRASSLCSEDAETTEAVDVNFNVNSRASAA